MDTISYRSAAPVTVEMFIDLLHASGLAARRPVDDRECIEGMLKNSNLVITAWAGDELVGIARALTDFHYACYLSDLAVAISHQKLGIGRELQRQLQSHLGQRCKIILIAAPAANDYYPTLGYSHVDRCWVADHSVDL